MRTLGEMCIYVARIYTVTTHLNCILHEDMRSSNSRVTSAAFGYTVLRPIGVLDTHCEQEYQPAETVGFRLGHKRLQSLCRCHCTLCSTSHKRLDSHNCFDRFMSWKTTALATQATDQLRLIESRDPGASSLSSEHRVSCF